MPRVSDAYRQARRDEIVAATLRVLRRRALRDLTMADIIEESGLSAGSVYSHFERKDQLLELVAARVVGDRLDALTAPGEGPPRSPAELVAWWLKELEEARVPFAALVQIWGEAASDPAMREIVVRRMTIIEDAFAVAAERWLLAGGGDPVTARTTARAMLTLCQGHIVRTAILGPQDPAETAAPLDRSDR
jgi:AcrR family transcriptional regulator